MRTSPAGLSAGENGTTGRPAYGLGTASRRIFLRAAGGILLARGAAPVLAGTSGPLTAGLLSRVPALLLPSRPAA